MHLTFCPLLGLQQLEAAKTTDLDISADRKMSKPKQSRHGKANDCRIYQTKLFIEEERKFDAFIKGSGKISSGMFCDTVAMQT